MEELQIVQTQLTTSVKMQLDSASTCLATLRSAQDRLEGVAHTMDGTCALAHRSSVLFDSPISASTPATSSTATATTKRYHNEFAMIKTVSAAYASFTATRHIYEQFAGLERDVERAFELMRGDWAGNMLLVAAIIARLDAFEAATLKSVVNTASTSGGNPSASPSIAHASTAPETAVVSAAAQSTAISQTLHFTLKRYFKRVEDVKRAFEERFWGEEPAKLFSSYLLSKDYRAITRMAKIVSRMAPEARSKMTSALDDIVSSKFAGARGMIVGDDDKESTDGLEKSLKLLDFYLSDLVMIRDGLATRFPPDMNIVTFFLLSYHRNIAQCIHQYVAKRPHLPSGDTLELLGWISEYHRSLEEHFAVAREDLEPQLLDARTEADITSAFLKDSGGKVAEWMGTLVRNECRTFANRTSLPEIDADDRYYSVAIIDLCRIVKQTVETAAGASRGTLLAKVVAETMRSVVEVYARGLSAAIAQEWTKVTGEQAVKAPMFEEHVIAFGNDAMRWISFSADFQESLLAGGIEEALVTGIAKSFKAANDMFMNIAKECCDVLAECVIRTLRPATSQFFTSDWSSANKQGSAMRTVDATVSDYLTDWKGRCDPFLLQRIVSDLLDRLLAGYFAAMRTRPPAIKASDQFSELVLADLAVLKTGFSRHRDPERVAKAVDGAMKIVRVVFATSPRIFLLDALALYKGMPELPATGLVEQLVMRRTDIDKKAYGEAAEGLRRRWKEEMDSGGGSLPTSAALFLRYLKQSPPSSSSSSSSSSAYVTKHRK